MGTKNYSVDMEPIMTLKTIEDFAQFWNYTTYSDLSSIFNPLKPGHLKSLAYREKPKQIDGIFIFKEGIAPAWEDPNHEKGAYF